LLLLDFDGGEAIKKKFEGVATIEIK